MNTIKMLMIVGAAIFLGCGTGGNNENRVRLSDTIVSRADISPKADSLLRDTSKKQSVFVQEINEEAMQKAVISKIDSSFHVYNNIRADYRIIGYALPDTNSRKMVLFSVFTSDVKDNPHDCPYGSYYGSPSPDELAIKYKGETGTFIKTELIASGKRETVYFQKKWVEFQKDL